MNRALVLVLSFLAWAAPAALAQGQQKASAKLYARAQGDAVQIAIEVQIDAGWHLYHGPADSDIGTEGAIGKPTTLEIDAAGFELEPAIYPAPVQVPQDIAGEKFVAYEHKGTIALYVWGKRVAADAKLEDLSATISGLTCEDNGTCIPYDEELAFAGAGPDALFAKMPARGSRTPPVVAVSATAPGHAEGAPPTPSGAQPQPSGSTPTVITSAPAQEFSLWLFLLSAVGWGLFTLLMPCTYPMIPITISYFTKQAAQRQGSTLPLSIAYGVGIIGTFVLIGLVVGPPIVAFAAHPITNLIIGVLFLYFSLTLFGMVNLQPPAFLLNVAGQASSKGGLAGVFLMGATLVVTSFTCTAPFVGTLLSTGASSGGLARVALGMAVFGATMAVPFVVLSMLPGRAKTIPRSGEWMHTLKVTLGFVEVAAAMKFLSNVDLVWEWNWLSRELFLFLWVAIFLGAALYLFGLIKLKDEAVAEISPARMVAGLLFLLLSAYSAYGALGNRMDPIMTAIIPPYSNSTAISGGKASAGPKWAIVIDDYDAALDQARKEDKLVLVNFTGHT